MPWYATGCTDGLLGWVGVANARAAGRCFHAAAHGASSSDSLACALGAGGGAIDAIAEAFGQVEGSAASNIPEAPDSVSSHLWGELDAIWSHFDLGRRVSSWVNLGLPDMAARQGAAGLAAEQAVHACIAARRSASPPPVSETLLCVVGARRDAVDAAFPSSFDLSSLLLPPSVRNLAGVRRQHY